MIKIYLGNVGSGKTACAVKEIAENHTNRLYYSNIMTKHLKNARLLKADMIVKNVVSDVKILKDGTKKESFEKKVNTDFWQGIKEPVSVIIDEAHIFLNSRMAMSKVNRLLNEWLAMIRRVLGESADYGELILISQLSRRLDVVAREMAHQVKYHVCWYRKTCLRCGSSWTENSDMPEPFFNCPNCDSQKLGKHSFVIEVWQFAGMNAFLQWKDFGDKTFYKHYLINDIERYFKNYNTLQWENLLSELY